MSGKRVIGAVVVLITLPVVLAAFEAVSFHVRNRNNGSMISSGEKREYLLYVPRSYDPMKADAAGHQHARRGRLAGPADGVERVEPAGRERRVDRRLSVGTRGGGAEGLGRGSGSRLTRDVRFISELIDKLEAAYNIDPRRIYANGLSNGGGMAFVLSCTLSDRIAAVGMVGAAQFCRGAGVRTASGTDDCLSWDRRSVRPVQRRHRGSPRVPFRRSRYGPRTGRGETVAGPCPSSRRWRRTSPAANTRTARTMRPSCSTPCTEAAIPGPAAGRFRSGSPGPTAAASTRRARCGRSFARIRFRGSSSPCDCARRQPLGHRRAHRAVRAGLVPPASGGFGCSLIARGRSLWSAPR